ncbi:MAG: Nif3-like dinuclear metal center hexameric protein [Clostridiales Family XIII bacterium]|jgi:dinuclear metal center YbgI/SA1388 family protein|nr:Nif3-like dinuclear metal center hexameric protein [Clostridiales Family XIII bacterium]
MAVEKMKLIAEIEKSAPLALAEPWDNSGWQIDMGRGEISKVLAALEISDAVIEEAALQGASLILTHHPLLFAPLRQISAHTIAGGYLTKLIRADVSVYSAHTTFDAAPGGMNDLLAEMIGLTNIKPFLSGEGSDGAVIDLGNGMDGGLTHAIARCGEFSAPRTFREILQCVEQQIGMESRLKTVGDPERLVKNGIVCGGGGGDLTEAAMRAGYDFYLTSDIKHHQAAWARESGLCLIDGGHFGTERHFVPVMAARLREAFGGALSVIETGVDLDPWRWDEL